MADEDVVSDLNVCRSCLNINVRMHSIMNTRYKEMYERVTNQQLELDRGCPDTMCYVCMCEVRRFHKFIEMSKRAEMTLRNLLLNKTEVNVMNKMRRAHELLTKESLAFGKVSCRNMKTTTVQLISIIDDIKDEEPEIVVSVEACDIKGYSVDEIGEFRDGVDYAVDNDDTDTDSENCITTSYNDIPYDINEKTDEETNKMSDFDETSKDKVVDRTSVYTVDETSKDKVVDRTSVFAVDETSKDKVVDRTSVYTVDETSKDKVVDRTSVFAVDETSKDKVVNETSNFDKASINKVLDKQTAFTVDKTPKAKVVVKTSEVVAKTSDTVEAENFKTHDFNETLITLGEDENNKTSVHSSDDDSVIMESGTDEEMDEAELETLRMLLCSEEINTDSDDSDEDERAKIQACIERLDEMDEDEQEKTKSGSTKQTDEVGLDSNDTEETDEDIQAYIILNQVPQEIEVEETEFELEEITENDIIEITVNTSESGQIDENEMIEVTRNALGSRKINGKKFAELLVYTDEYKDKMNDTVNLSVNPSENQGTVDLPVAKKSRIHEVLDSSNTHLSVKPSEIQGSVDLPVAKKSKIHEVLDSSNTHLSVKPSENQDTVDLPVAKKSKIHEVLDSSNTHLSVKPSEIQGTVDLPVAKKSKIRKDIFGTLYTHSPVEPSESQDTVDLPVAKKSKIWRDIFGTLNTHSPVEPSESKGTVDLLVAKKSKIHKDIFNTSYTQSKVQDNDEKIIATKEIEPLNTETDKNSSKDIVETESLEDNMVTDLDKTLNEESKRIIQLIQTVCVNLERLTPETIEKYTNRYETCTNMSEINELTAQSDNECTTENDLLVIRDIKKSKSKSNKLTAQSANEYITSNDLLVARDIEGYEERIVRQKCQLCDFTTDIRHVFGTHMQMHSKNYKYVCPNGCGHGFNSLTSLNDHKSRNCNRCEICDRAFAFDSYLKKHMHSHDNVKTYKCSYCTKLFKYKFTMVKHVQNQHLTQKTNLTCTICLKQYHFQKSLYNHMEKHKFKLRTITKCEFERFLDKKMALVHFMKMKAKKRKKQEPSPYMCDLCNIKPDYGSIMQ